MIVIVNHSGETWEFGSMRIPPGSTIHSLEAVQGAIRTTAISRYASVAGGFLAPRRFEVRVEGARTFDDILALDADPAACEPPVVAHVVEEPTVEAIVEDDGDPPSHGRPLSAHSRKELREIATDLGIEGAASMVRADLLAAITGQLV